MTGLRKQYGEQFQKKHNLKLGFMSAFVKAAATALQDQPIVNAAIEKNEIVYRDYVDISVAVATPKVSQQTRTETAANKTLTQPTVLVLGPGRTGLAQR